MISERGNMDADPNASEEGYALVAAVATILFFAVVALGVLGLTQSALVIGGADVDAARARAAADAGIAIALRGLLTSEPGTLFPIDGTPRQFRFDGAELVIIITDERGKIPLNLLDEQQLTLLLEYSGLSGDPLITARDSYLDWLDEDDEPRPQGAERLYYRARGVVPRNAGFLTLGEVGQVRGITPIVARRIAAVATTDFGNGSFDARTATPVAIRIMYPAGDGAIDEILRAREGRGQRTALDFTDQSARIGRPLTIAVNASFPSGAVAIRQCVVELTGAARRPYVTRYCS
jgi:general secretion pathway protein K